MTDSKVLDIEAIAARLPHRFPFLMVDRVLSVEPGKSVVAIKNVTCNEPHFSGHFPERAVMPGVLTIEAIAQAGAVAVLAAEENRGKLPFFAGIDRCRFKRIVEPGDTLTLECVFVRVRGPIAKGEGRALVGDELAADAVLTVFLGE